MGLPRPSVLIIRKDLDTEEEEQVRRQRITGADRGFWASSGPELYGKAHVTVDWTSRPVFRPPLPQPPPPFPVDPPSQDDRVTCEVSWAPDNSSLFRTNLKPLAEQPSSTWLEMRARLKETSARKELAIVHCLPGSPQSVLEDHCNDNKVKPTSTATEVVVGHFRELQVNNTAMMATAGVMSTEGRGILKAAIISTCPCKEAGNKGAATGATEPGRKVSLGSGLYDTAMTPADSRAHLASSSSRTILEQPVGGKSVQSKPGRLPSIPSGANLVETEYQSTYQAVVRSDSSTKPGIAFSPIQLVGCALIGEELVVNNVGDFDRLQWQRTETVEQADGSNKTFVQAVSGTENNARYRVAPEDEGCCIRIVVASGSSTDIEVFGRDTPVVMAPKRASKIFDLSEARRESLDLWTSVSDGRQVSKSPNRRTSRLREVVGASSTSPSAKLAVIDARDDPGGVEVLHNRSQLDFLSSSLGAHFLFTSLTLDTIEQMCKSMKYVQISAGSNIIEQGDIGTNFYVVDSGEFKVSTMKTEEHDEVKVLNTMRRGQCFGESVLMTVNATRMASVCATVDCGAWVMHCSVYEQSMLINCTGCPVEEFLKGVDIFYHLSPAIVRGIAACCEFVELPANTVIFQEGDLSDELYFIFKGKVTVFDADRRKLATLKTRDLFGEGAVLAGKSRRTATVVTRTVTSLLRLPSAVIVKLFPLGLGNLLDEKLVLQVLKRMPGFTQLSEQMLKDCGLMKDIHLRSITLELGALVAEQHKPAEAIFIIKRGGLLVTKRQRQELGTQSRRLAEREYFGTTAAIAGGTYHESATATEELTQVLRLPARHVRMLHDACALAAREELLKNVPLLSTPSALPLLKALAVDSSTATFAMGTVIVNDGKEQSDGDNFFLIKSGVANMCEIDPSTRQMRILAQLRVGDYFGEHILLESFSQHSSDTPCRETVVAVTEVECIVLSRSSFDVHVGAWLGSMLRELSEMMDSMGDTLKPRSRIYQKDLVVHCTLGMGRFGRVRLVQHQQTGTTYAMKMMGRRQIVEAEQESHLQNEVMVMKRLRHPFCTNLFATYVDSKYFYMLLEVTSGGELFRVLEQAPEGRLSNAASCFYAANVVCAIEYLHKQNIIYRDLKPENLLLDARGYLKLVDFGFAKRVHGRTYTLCGTADYLAPEIVSQQGHGFEVDLWALGVLVYEMLVGCSPFEGETKGDTKQIYDNVLRGDYTMPPGALSPEASNFIDGLLTVDCLTRLGCGRTGMRDVKMHPWFDGLDWGMLLERRMESPFTPEISDALDTHNFDEYDECEKHIDDYEEPLVALGVLDELFNNY